VVSGWEGWPRDHSTCGLVVTRSQSDTAAGRPCRGVSNSPDSQLTRIAPVRLVAYDVHTVH